MEQKAFFYANTASNLAHGNTARVRCFVVGTDHNAFKNLNTLFVAFFDFLVHAYGVATTRIYDGCFFLLVVYFLDKCKTHNYSSVLSELNLGWPRSCIPAAPHHRFGAYFSIQSVAYYSTVFVVLEGLFYNSGDSFAPVWCAS